MTVLKKCFYLFLFMLPGLFIGSVICVLVTQLHNSLARLFPSVFHLYNIVLESELHALQEARLNFIALFFTALAVVFITQRYNNERFEYIITRTDGIFYLKDSLPVYLKRFALSDVIASLVVGSAFTVPIHFIPMQFFAAGSDISTMLYPFKLLTQTVGPVFAPVILTVLLLAAHAAVTPLSLLYYRAKWLSGFAED